jgi:hypothetical protein
LDFLLVVCLKDMERGRRHQPLHSIMIKAKINRYFQHDNCGVFSLISWVYVSMKFVICLELS